MNRTHFLELVGTGDAERVRKVVTDHPSLASCQENATPSAILHALYAGQNDVASILIEHGVLNAAEAAAIGDAASLQRLLSDNADRVSQYTADGWTPLHLAAFFGHSQTVDVLLAAGARYDENAKSRNQMGNLPLHAALAGAGDEETVERLLDAGAGVQDRAAGGVTPLHLAASRGNQRLVATLLARGAEVDARLDTGETPADIARQRGFPEVARALD